MHTPATLPCMPPCHEHPHACPTPCMSPPPCTHPLPMGRMTDVCENITFPQLLLRTVKRNRLREGVNKWRLQRISTETHQSTFSMVTQSSVVHHCYCHSNNTVLRLPDVWRACGPEPKKQRNVKKSTQLPFSCTEQSSFIFFFDEQTF